MFPSSLNYYFIYADVPFIEPSFYYKPLSSPSMSPSDHVHIFVVFDSHVLSSVPKDSPPPPLL